MNKNNLKSDDEFILKKGIYGNNIFFYLSNGYFYIQVNHIRSFKFSLRRAKNVLNIVHTDILFKTFIKHIKSIKLEKVNENLFFLNISYPVAGINKYIFPHKIKLTEINNYLIIYNTN